MNGNIPPVSNKITTQVLALLKGSPYRANVRDIYSFKEPLVEVLLIDFEVVGICQNPVFDIKPIEPIRIEIYEHKNPRVFVLREDFPSVPHLMISEDGKTKFLCYSDVADEELRLRMNGRFLIECVNNWFVKTARNELHHPDQPLEPFFLGNDGVIVIRRNFINKNRPFNKFEKKTPNLLLQVEDSAKNKDVHWYASIWLCLPASADNIIQKLPHTLSELLSMFDDEKMLKFFTEQVNALWKIRQSPKNYQFIFNNSVNALLDCKCLIALYIPLYSANEAEIKKQDIRVFKLSEPFSRLLELVGWRYNSKSKKLESLTSKKTINIPMEMLQFQCAFESNFAQQLNGVDSDYKNSKIVIIGVGALGSQIFINCIRAGFGKWTLIDNDVIWPHNLARHSLGQNALGNSKAHELAKYAKNILLDADVTSIADNIFVKNNAEITTAFHEAKIILDVSTSIAAERVIALDIKSAARRISTFLNQAGTFLTMLVEDVERNVTLDFLEMQSYKILCTTEEYSSYFDSSDSLAYSASCRDITSNISQDVVALSAAITSSEIKKCSTSNDACISIWQITNDGITKRLYPAETWMTANIDDWDIFINNSLVEEMMAKRSERIPNETGGVLVGNCDSLRNRLYIVDMIFSPSDSIESPNSFIRGSDSLPEKMVEISNRTHDSLYYVGEWHSHPNSNTSMSNDDKILLNVVTEWCAVDCGIGCIIIAGDNNTCSIHIKIHSSERVFSKSL
ncbi:MAG: ThiF family adenylyltransferase [Defluviitaleaceae bacterium]|nr:ThiF family adenylyltransferase [Defluviitaleaceae bacterium]